MGWEVGNCPSNSLSCGGSSTNAKFSFNFLIYQVFSYSHAGLGLDLEFGMCPLYVKPLNSMYLCLAYMMHFQCSIIQIIDIMIWRCRWLYYELDLFTEALHLAPQECHYSVRVPGSQ